MRSELPMKSGIKHFAANYVGKWWLSSAVVLVSLALFVITSLVESERNGICRILLNVLLAALCVSLLGVIGAAVWNLVMRRWAAAIGRLLLLSPLAGVIAVSMVILMLSSWDSEYKDHFSDNLTIPDNIAVAQPQKWREPTGGR